MYPRALPILKDVTQAHFVNVVTSNRKRLNVIGTFRQLLNRRLYLGSFAAVYMT